MQAVKDETRPGDTWEFDADVAAAFDDMLARSIPDYANMRALVTQLAIALPASTYLDLGCSRGGAIEGIAELTGPNARFVGWEVSDPMLAAAKARFSDDPRVTIERRDLRDGFPTINADTVLSILTLQFTPIEHRQRIVADVFDTLKPSGRFLLVEKVMGGTARMDRLMVDAYYKQKRDHGYSEEDIESKRLSLEGVLVPVTADWNRDLLTSAGFRHVECFWRSLNFAGWLAIKE